MPEDIATLYSQAHMQGARYWDFTASRQEVRGQLRHRIAREHAERPGSPQQESQPRPKEQPHMQAAQVEPEAPSGPVDVPDTVPGTAPGTTSDTGPQLEMREVADSPLPPRQASPAPTQETMPQPLDGGTARWHALQCIFAPPKAAVAEVPLAPPIGIEEHPPVVAVFSLAGGVGKTCLVATLGRALSARGERVLLADTAAHGPLPFYFGSCEFKPGVVRTFSPPGSVAGPEVDAPVRVLSLEGERYPGDGGEHDPLLEELVRDGRDANRILVDVATGSRQVTSRLLLLRPTVLVPILPDVSSVASLGSLEAFLGRGSWAAFYLLNQFDASSPLHLDVRRTLQQQLGDRLLPFVLRYSSAVSEALAEGMTVIDYAPGSAAAGDYWDLAGWLRGFSAPTAAGRVRWSER